MARPALPGEAWIALAALLWSTIGIVSRIPLGRGVEPLEVAFWRAVIAAGCYAAHAGLTGRLRVTLADLPGLAGFALIGVTAFFWSFLVSVREGGAALAAILLYTAPAWVAIGSALWLEERLTRRKLAALVASFAGVVLVALGAGGGGGQLTLIGLGAGLLSGMSYASYYLLGKRWFARYPAPAVYAVILPLGAAALFPAVDPGGADLPSWLAIGYLAVVPTYLGYLVYSVGLTRIEATRAATIATIEPVLAGALAWLVWGERFGLAGYAGAALVMTGVWLMTADSRA